MLMGFILYEITLGNWGGLLKFLSGSGIFLTLNFKDLNLNFWIFSVIFFLPTQLISFAHLNPFLLLKNLIYIKMHQRALITLLVFKKATKFFRAEQFWLKQKPHTRDYAQNSPSNVCFSTLQISYLKLDSNVHSAAHIDTEARFLEISFCACHRLHTQNSNSDDDVHMCTLFWYANDKFFISMISRVRDTFFVILCKLTCKDIRTNRSWWPWL